MRALQQPDLTELRVADIMQCAVATVTMDTPLSDVARCLWDRHISGAPVVAEDGRLVGVVSATDLVRVRGYGPGNRRTDAQGYAASAHARQAAFETHGPTAVFSIEPTAGDVMTPALFSVRPTTTVTELAQFLTRAGIHRALVLDGEQLLGIVTTSDIVQALAGPTPSSALEPLCCDEDDLEC